MGKFIDLTDQKFGRLNVIKRGGYKNKVIMWECVCDCGKHILVRGDQLRGGHTKSCGCYKHDKLIDMLSCGQMEHGKHHDSGKRLYRVWCSMKARCHNPNHVHFPLYGGRGIDISPEWETDYSKFKEWAISHGYDDSKSIDRIDNNLGYCPANCRWIPIKDQPKNRRTNHMVPFGGEMITISECSRRTGIPISTLCFRAKKHRDLFERVRRW